MTPRRVAPRRSFRVAAGVAVALVFVLGVSAVGTGAPQAAAGVVPRPGAGCAPVTLNATPTRGPAPLLVNFSAQVPSSTVPTYAWTFGDGTYYNGSGEAYATPVHRFSTPGNYSVVVAVNSSAGRSVCSTSVTVTPAPFAAVAKASPTAGAAPLNVTFVAQITGGTGTYLSAVWSFDDGDNGSGLQVTYTFVRAGIYQVLLNVTDSSGAVAHGSVLVNVLAGAGSGGPRPASPPSLWGVPLEVLAIALGVAAAALLLGGLALRRFDRSVPSADPSFPSLPAGATFERASLVASAVPAGVAARPGGGPDAAIRPVEMASPEIRRPEIPPETLRLSQRVIVHLAAQGALPDDTVATEAFTQGGMAGALGVPQNRLSNVLRRLRNAGAITEDVRHVSGRARRMKVYRLTVLGERLAHDLRRRARLSASRGPGRR